MGRVDDFLERHPWSTFPVVAVAIGAIPLALWHETAGQPHLWPRLAMGAAIGTGLMAVLTCLAMIRRSRRTVVTAMALVVLLAISVVAGMVGFTRNNRALQLEDPGQTELVGAVVAIDAWGAVAVLVISVHVLTRQARGRRHVGRVEEFGQGVWYAAACDCGWRGEVVRDSSTAFTNAGNHANRVQLTVRKIAHLP